MKFKSIFSVFIALFLFLSPACSAPSESTDESLGLNADFMRGFDASMVSQLEEYGSSFYNENGAKEDIFKILKAHGVNWIRLRIWNAPQDTTPGQNNYERTLAMAKRIKQNGFNFLLDFHYSDNWADPAKQSLPAEWDNVSSIEELCSKVSEYTKKILADLKSEGCAPDLVQLGNEINSGMFLTKSDGTTASSIDCYSWTGHTEGNKNLLKVLQSASSAVSEIDSSIKKMIHLASSKGDSFDWWFKNLQNLKGVDYDYIGLSYYPFEEHGTSKQLRENISYLKKTYKSCGNFLGMVNGSLWRQHKQHCMVRTSRNPSRKKSCRQQKHTAQKFKDTDLQRKKMRFCFSTKPSNSCKSNNGSHIQCRRLRNLLLGRRLDSKFKNPRHLGKSDALRS